MTEIRASCFPGEIRVAVLDGDELLDFAIWRPGAPDGFFDLHVGRVLKRVSAMAGAFVAIEGAEGFLADSDGAAGLTEGDFLFVRVTRTAQGGKGPRVSAQDDRKRPGGPVRLVQRGPGGLERLAARYPEARILADEAASVAALRPALSGRLTFVARAFDDALESEIEALSEAYVALPGGMRASIFPTPALTAIDVDGGASTGERGAKNAVQFAANRAALPELARQIRLRNLSGAILIDLAGLAIRRRAALAPDLESALAGDPARPRLLGFSHLGLAEILRPRGDAPLHEKLRGPHAAGLLALRHATLALEKNPSARLALRAAPAIIAALQADGDARAALARRAAHPMMLHSDPALPERSWAIEHANQH